MPNIQLKNSYVNGTFMFTGIVTTGSTLAEYYYYVSAYRILYSDDAQKWIVYRESDVDQDKVKLLQTFSIYDQA